jgi:voltage-gated potassium channel Kch
MTTVTKRMNPSRSTADPGLQSTIVARTVYQMFMVTITLLMLVIMVLYYLAPLPETVRQVLYILDSLLCPILLYDFLAHVYYAPNRLKYLLTLGWLDLLGALPGLPALRLVRIPGLIVTLRQLRDATPAESRQVARQRLAESTLLFVTLVVIVVVTAGSILIVLIEAPVDSANIKTGSDAVWWSIVTVATVGYGDRFPVTDAGRLIGTLMIVMGVSLFSVLTSYIATQFMARRKGSGPGEIDLLRRDLSQQIEGLRGQAAAENTALRAELAHLRALLTQRIDAPPPER